MHLFLKGPVLSLCPKCGKEFLPHIVCWNCGYYKKREIVNVLAKLDKKERRQKEKEIKAKEKEDTEEKPLTWQELSKK